MVNDDATLAATMIEDDNEGDIDSHLTLNDTNTNTHDINEKAEISGK